MMKKHKNKVLRACYQFVTGSKYQHPKPNQAFIETTILENIVSDGSDKRNSIFGLRNWGFEEGFSSNSVKYLTHLMNIQSFGKKMP